MEDLTLKIEKLTNENEELKNDVEDLTLKIELLTNVIDNIKNELKWV